MPFAFLMEETGDEIYFEVRRFYVLNHAVLLCLKLRLRRTAGIYAAEWVSEKETFEFFARRVVHTGSESVGELNCSF